MIRYFKLAYDIIINNILFNLLIILEVTGMLVLTNTVIASYNSKQMLYLPYKDILHEKGVVFAAYGHEILEFSENKDVQAICERHKGNIDYRELTDLLLNTDGRHLKKTMQEKQKPSYHTVPMQISTRCMIRSTAK